MQLVGISDGPIQFHENVDSTVHLRRGAPILSYFRRAKYSPSRARNRNSCSAPLTANDADGQFDSAEFDKAEIARRVPIDGLAGRQLAIRIGLVAFA